MPQPVYDIEESDEQPALDDNCQWASRNRNRIINRKLKNRNVAKCGTFSPFWFLALEIIEGNRDG